MAEEIAIKISKELVELANLTNDDLENQSQLLLIFELFQQEKISLSRAAELSNLKMDLFIIEFKKRRLIRPVGPKTAEEAELEYQSATKHLE